MNVRIFKLVDGSEIIGKIERFSNSLEIFKLEDPLEIKYRMGYDGNASAVMTRYNYFGDEKVVHINASAVITSYEVSEKYGKVYEESLVDTAPKSPEDPEKRAEAVKEVIAKVISGNNTVH